MTTERDPQTRVVLSWLREDQHENPERMLLRALDEVDTTPQRRSKWPAWRDFRMNKLALTATTTAAVLMVAVIGYTLAPAFGITGPGAGPSLLAKGNFVQKDWGPVEFQANREGAGVTGRATVGADASTPPDPEQGYLTVEFDCARTTEDGLTMIGGHVTGGAGVRFAGWPEGTRAAVVLKPGSPVRTAVWVGAVLNFPGTETTDCAAYLDAWVTWQSKFAPNVDWLRDDSQAVVEFGE